MFAGCPVDANFVTCMLVYQPQLLMLFVIGLLCLYAITH